MNDSSASESPVDAESWVGGINWHNVLPSHGVPGGIELIFSNADQDERLYELLAGWVTLRKKSGSFAYPHVAVVTPDQHLTSSQLAEKVTTTLARLFGHPPSGAISTEVSRRVQVAHVAAGDGVTLVDTIANGISETLFILTKALDYSKAFLSDTEISGLGGAAYQATPLVEALSPIVSDTTGLIVVDVPCAQPPTRDEFDVFDRLSNVGYRLSFSISIDNVEQAALEDAWLNAWKSGDVSMVRTLNDTMKSRFSWPSPDSPIALALLLGFTAHQSNIDAPKIDGLPPPLRTLACALEEIFQCTPSGSTDSTKSIPDEWLPLFRVVLAKGAYDRKHIRDALELADPALLPNHAQNLAVNLLFSAIEDALLTKAENSELLDIVADATEKLIRYLAKHPHLPKIRLRLSEVLSPQRTGLVGPSILMHSLMRLSMRPAKVAPESSSHIIPATPDEFMTFVDQVLTPHQGQALDVETFSIPEDLIVPSADELMDCLCNLIDYSESHDKDDLDTQTLGLFATVGVALSKHSSDPDIALVILRVWGERLAQKGLLQHSRDIAETLLRVSRGSDARNRLGWLGYADIYHRGGNAFEALVGLCCTFAIDIPRKPDEILRELELVVRSMRDMGMPPLARIASQFLSTTAKSINVGAKQRSRIDFLSLSIRAQEALHGEDQTPSTLGTLIDDLVSHLESTLSLGDSPLPAAILLGQLANEASEKSTPLSQDALLTIKHARSLLDGHQALLFDLACGTQDQVHALLTYVESLEEARYGLDVGYDLRNACLAARRVLSSPQACSDPETVVFASELLSDLGIDTSTQMKEGACWLPTKLSGPAETARTLSTLGIDIVMLASNDQRRLMVTQISDGNILTSREMEENIFSIDQFDQWSDTYPYGYASFPSSDEEDELEKARRRRMELFYGDDDRFFDSMQHLSLGLMIDRPTIFVADPFLQRIPPNLYVNNSDFLGRQVSVGVAPSLTWLSKSISIPKPTCKGTVAWISDSAGKAEWNATLNVLAERVHYTLMEHSISLDRSTKPPESLKNAELAIIGAHGGLSSTNRYFRVVSDENHGRIAPDNLASALQGTRVVILFVCSGGRIDNHPFSHSTLGLPRELLSAGVEAVIASPWPLDVYVPAHWLPQFMKEWLSGKSVMEATFLANKQVGTQNRSPEYELAMTVYGNPLACRNDP